MLGERRIVLWVPDWSLSAVAVAVPPGSPAATVKNGRIEVTTRTARQWGVRRGQSQSHATQLCPDLMLLSHDSERDAAAFEAVLRVFDEHVAAVESIQPGLAWARMPTVRRGGKSEEEILAGLVESVAAELGIEVFLGIANGTAAALAAVRRSKIIPKEKTKEFLKELPLTELVSLPTGTELEEIVELLDELGVRKVSALHDLGRDKLLTRFGEAGETLWRVSNGEDLRQSRATPMSKSVEVTKTFAEPVEQLSHALFDLKALVHSFCEELRLHGLSLERLTVDLHLEGEMHYSREWVFFGAAEEPQVLNRVLWQVRAWQDGLALTDEAIPRCLLAVSLQATQAHLLTETALLWGGKSKSESVNRSLSQIQLSVGKESVSQLSNRGGLDPRERVVLVPWGEAEKKENLSGEWEGRVTGSPLVMFDEPLPLKIIGDNDDGTVGPIWMTARGLLSGTPQMLVLPKADGGLEPGSYRIEEVGPVWAHRRKWWLAEPPRGYLQVTVEAGKFLLLWREGWYLEGIYAGADV